MKYSFAVAALAGLAAAADISIIPSCALPCITDAVSKATPCAVTDFTCVCKNKDALISAATGCVVNKCGIDVATGKVLPATNTFCDQVLAEASSSKPATTTAAPTTATSTITSSEKPSTTESSTEETPSPSASESSTEQNSSYPPTTMDSSVAPTYTPSAISSKTSTPTTVPTAGAAHMGSIGTAAMLLMAGAVAAL